MTTQPTTERTALIRGRDVTPERVAAYLPANYRVLTPPACFEPEDDVPTVIVKGTDSCGWTLDGYVLPRLASGLMFGEEVTS